MSVADIVDAVIEAPVVTSFTNLGASIRRRLHDWRPLDDYDLTGRTVLVTGATSGLGLHTATRLAALGATVVMNGRRRDKAERRRDEVVAASGSDSVEVVVADMSELDQVAEMTERIRAVAPGIDTIVHNAGALSDRRRTNSAGIEATVASQVLGPFALTAGLLSMLQANSVANGRASRVITVSSGGMYTAPLTVRRLEMREDEYGGSEQYSRAKRAQVTLSELWAERVPTDSVVFHAMHPGWADTPGVQNALPRFRAVMRPLLRDLEQGADTIVWLTADDEALDSSGEFWLDRRHRSTHRLPTTRRKDTPELRAELWAWCDQQTGASA